MQGGPEILKEVARVLVKQCKQKVKTPTLSPSAWLFERTARSIVKHVTCEQKTKTQRYHQVLRYAIRVGSIRCINQGVPRTTN